jgi:ABC-type phosphate transport system auxiliary subunit
VRKFKKAHKLPHDWATLVLNLRKFNTTDTNPDKSEYGQQTLDTLTQLIADCGDELREALAIVSQADGSINASRSQQINQYHRNRIGKLEKNISQIDAALDDPTTQQDSLEVAELTSQKKHLEYQLKDHGEKIDKRGHGLHLTKMRRKHR